MTLSSKSFLSEAQARLAGRGNGRTLPDGAVYVGVDLGTANLVLTVLDSSGRPVLVRVHAAQVVRDGLVVDFTGAVDSLRQMKTDAETELGLALASAASGYPPGVPLPEVRAVGHVLAAAGLDACG